MYWKQEQIKKGAFKRTFPLFQQWCDQAVDEKGIEIITKNIQEGHKKLMEWNNSKVENKNIHGDDDEESDEYVSFPVIDKRKKDTRLKPFNKR